MYILPYFIPVLLAFCIQDVHASRIKRFLFAQRNTHDAVDTGSDIEQFESMMRLRGCAGSSGSMLVANARGPYQWSKWSSWTSCNGTCQIDGGLGKMHRTRYCGEGQNVAELHFCQEPYKSGKNGVSAGNGGGDGDDGDDGDDDDFSNIDTGDVGIDLDVAEDSHGSSSTSRKTYRDYEYQTCVAQNCVLNIWSDWETWSQCSVSCGAGVMSRSRHCASGSDCVGDSSESVNCMQPSCAKAGGWSSWTEFGQCSRSCGNGVQFRLRQCNNPTPQNGGLNCSGSSQEFRACTKGHCPIDGGWSNFTDMSCSATCGLGVQTSFRTCTNPSPANGGKNCSGVSHKFRHCKVTECSVDGSWTNWGEWSACPVSSGIGQQIRIRNCTNPAPVNGGKDCTGDDKESKYCVVNKWSGWSLWSNCSTTCGAGTRTRTRVCISADDCVGNSTENDTCSLPRCLNVVDGLWSDWGNWSDCSNTCGNGTQTRTRLCNNPAPQDGGLNCTGPNVESGSCSLNPCPIDGGWSEFQNLSCSVTCGKGTFVSVRACNNPVPQFGGKDCSGLLHETHECDLTPCVIDGSWRSWSNWTDCSSTCGNGTQTRTRLCDNPAPQNGGQPCSENDIETQACFTKECPIDGGWSAFHNVSCSVTCGRGQEVAIRYCNNPAPQFGGKDCQGLSHELTDCIMPSCVIDGNWSDWSVATKCGSMCGDGYTMKYRTCTNPVPENGGKNCTGNSEERLGCNSGPCPADVPTCHNNAVAESLNNHALFAPTRAGPCSNMDYIPEENMLKTMCDAPSDSNTWTTSIDVRTNCERIPLYSPLAKVHREYKTRNYGIILSCHQSQLKIATETCEDGVHEQDISLDIEDGWDYYTMKW